MLACLVALVVTPLVFPRDAAADERTMRERIRAILMVRKHAPPPKFWKRLGHTGQDALVNLATDIKQKLMIRVRAYGCLAYYPNVRSRRVLLAALNNPEVKMVLRQAALRALGAGFRLEAVHELTRFIYDRSPDLRISAAEGLYFVPLHVARRILVTALENEKELQVREAIMASLNRQTRKR